MNFRADEAGTFRILLLSVSSTSFFYEQVVIPFGLVSIGSYVDRPGFRIKGIEMNHPAEKTMDRYLRVDRELLDEITAFGPHVVAMSTYATNMYNVMFWAGVIKKNIPGVFVVAGGNHVSYIAKECLEKCPEMDAVVRFEGEIPFKMLCDRLSGGSREFGDIPGLTYRAGQKIIENPQGELIRDLDMLPMMNRAYFADQQPAENVSHADIISARGCPFNCTFCNCNHYWQKRHRTRSIPSVIEELKALSRGYPIRSVRFRDEAITLNKKHCLKICDEIVSNDIRVEFQAHSRLDGLDEEVIEALSRAGFRLLFIGVESGSRTVLKRLQKGIDISRLERIIGLLRRHGIAFRLSFMSATPGENLRETLKTVRLIRRLGLKRTEYYMGYGVDIYPGTEECRRFLELNPDYPWLIRHYRFRGKYFAVRDPRGNIIQPKYREYGLPTLAFIYFMLSPGYLVDKLRAFAKKILNRLRERRS